MHSRLIGTGGYLPKKQISNAELAIEKNIDTTDEWIFARTGIVKRHICEPDETSLDMAYHAAKEAIAKANIDKNSIDLIIFSTCTPSGVMPSDACKLQNMLNLNSNAIAFDLNAACSGFVYGMITANNFIKANQAKCALIVGSDKMTSLLDWQDRSTCVLFGDGAGAAILKADTYPGVLNSVIGADGKKQELLYTAAGTNYINMCGQEVFKHAVKKLDALVTDIISPVGLNNNEIDWFVPHQANIRIIKSTAKMLKMPLERVVQTVGEHANTSAASIPLALNSIFDKLSPGEHILIEAFGSGFTWGGLVLKF